jgi:hypothetical protein
LGFRDLRGQIFGVGIIVRLDAAPGVTNLV